jgi:hypothetical protein
MGGGRSDAIQILGCVTLAALALSTACATGDAAPDAGSSALGAFDRDGDRALSREEYANAITDGFATLDANGDGSLYGPDLQRIPPSLLAELDTNRDGVVTFDEYLDHQVRSFVRCDGDHDARLSESEAEGCPKAR